MIATDHLPADLAAAVATAEQTPPAPDTATRALACLDYTSLGEDDTAEVVRGLCARAMTPAGPVAAVCVWPAFVAVAKQSLTDSPVRIATVVNFPDGGTAVEPVVAETERALSDGAQEIDLVLPYRAVLDGEVEAARDVLTAVRRAARGATLKVIFETAAFPDAVALDRAADLAVLAGADFLKTSTGKHPGGGASLAAAAVLMGHIRAAARNGRIIGLKPSGGIRTAEQAARYIALADAVMGAGWAVPQRFRLGASGLLDTLLGTLGQETGGVSGLAGDTAY